MKANRVIYVLGAITVWWPQAAIVWWFGHLSWLGLAFCLYAIAASQWIAFGFGARFEGERYEGA